MSLLGHSVVVVFGGKIVLKEGTEQLMSYSQFHQHFMSSYFANFLLPKNFKHKLQVQKSCAKHLCTKSIVIQNHHVNLSPSLYCKLSILIVYSCVYSIVKQTSCKRETRPFVASPDKNKINGSNCKHKQALRPLTDLQ